MMAKDSRKESPGRVSGVVDDDGIVLEQGDEEQRSAQADQAAEVAAEYDSESRVRSTDWKPLGLLVSGVAIFTALYHMYTAYFGGPPTLIHRSIHVSLILFLAFIL